MEIKSRNDQVLNIGDGTSDKAELPRLMNELTGSEGKKVVELAFKCAALLFTPASTNP